MNFCYVLRCSIRELQRRNDRSLFLLFSYFLATSAMVILVSLILSSKEAASDILRSTGTHFVAFAPSFASSHLISEGAKCSDRLIDSREAFVMDGVPTELLSAAIVNKVKSLPEVEDAAPFLLFRLYDGKLGPYNIGGVLIGANKAFQNNSCAESDIIEGRFLTLEDKGRALLEESFARSTALTVGSHIIIGTKTFSICGIVNTGIRSGKADIYVPFHEAEDVIRERMRAPLLNGEINAVFVEVKNARFQEKAIVSTRRLIPGALVSTYSCYKPATNVMNLNEGSSWLITAIIGIVAIILAMKSQAASVSEKKKDIAVLRIIGWSRLNIASLVIGESLIHAAIGGLLGCTFSAVALRFLPVVLFGSTGKPLPLSFMLLLVALLGSFMSGVIAGIIPAIRAIQLIPIKGLTRL